MEQFHLTQLNTARVNFTLDDVRMANFVDGLGRINALHPLLQESAPLMSRRNTPTTRLP